MAEKEKEVLSKKARGESRKRGGEEERRRGCERGELVVEKEGRKGGSVRCVCVCVCECVKKRI